MSYITRFCQDFPSKCRLVFGVLSKNQEVTAILVKRYSEFPYVPHVFGAGITINIYKMLHIVRTFPNSSKETENDYRMLLRMTFTSKATNRKIQKGLLLGAYTGREKTDITLTGMAERFARDTNLDIKNAVLTNFGLAPGSVQVFDLSGGEFRAVAIAGLGPQPTEGIGNLYTKREFVRNAAGAGARVLQERGIGEIFVEHMGDAEAAAEGATLGVWIEQQFRNYEDRLTESKVFLYEKGDSGKHKQDWVRGFEKAKGQNFARYLTALPSNVMTPSTFGQNCADKLSRYGVDVTIHNRKWIKKRGMEAFLAASQGSREPPVLVEMKYSGGGREHVVIVGKGCTSEPGAYGACRGPAEGEVYLCADMAGAAVTAGSLMVLSKLGIKINITALLPMYEVAPSENAFTRGSLGKLLVESTSHFDHRAALADVIGYAVHLSPSQVISIAVTLSRSVSDAMAAGPCGGSFTTNGDIYDALRRSGESNGDRLWGAPTFDPVVSGACGGPVVTGGNSLFSAGLLGEFVPAALLKELTPPAPVQFTHIDIFGTALMNPQLKAYLREGYAAGLPVRTLVDYLSSLSKTN